MPGEMPRLLMLIILCGHIRFLLTGPPIAGLDYDDHHEDYVNEDYNVNKTKIFDYNEYYEHYMDPNVCGQNERFCFSTGTCKNESEACDGQCGAWNHFCPSTDSCINKWTACDGNCPDDWPNVCDNGTICYPNFYINDLEYACVDRSDEHRTKEKPPPLDNSSLDKFLQLNIKKHEVGLVGLGVDCQDGTVHKYVQWCEEEFSRMCGGVSTTDYFICHNSTIWKDRGKTRWCKVPGKSIHERFICDGKVGRSYDCGANDYSDEVCPMNKYDSLMKHNKSINNSYFTLLGRYFRCKDNSSLIHPTLVCDGYNHCGDESDENQCEICPRVNNMTVHGQVVHLNTEEIGDLAHLRSTAIMKCVSPYGKSVCATPGDGIHECAWELKGGSWQTQDEVELTSETLWKTLFKYMSYIFLVSVVVLFKILQLGYLCQKSKDDVPVIRSYHRMVPHDDKTFPLSIPVRTLSTAEPCFPTPFFTTMEPVQLTQQFRQYYIQNHKSEHFAEFFNLCLTLSQFLSTQTERDIFLCGVYAIEAQIHGISPVCTDHCLKQHSSGALEPMFDAVYGSFSDKFPITVKNVLYAKDKLSCFHYLWRLKTLFFRYFLFYYDIVQEFVLLSFILGTAGLGISTTFWLEISEFNYIHIMVYLFVSSVFLPMLLFAVQIAFSSQIDIIFGIEKPSVAQKILLGCCCFILFPFIPAVLFFKMEKKQLKMFNSARSTSKILNRLNSGNIVNDDIVSLKHEIVASSKILIDTNSEITMTKFLYKKFKEWELAIEMPIQSSLAIIFSFMKKSTTVVNQVFQNWFISDTKSLFFLVGMSLRSIIAVQISDESARRNNFLGIKSKMFLVPLYMTTSIPRIASIVIFMSVPLGLMNLLGHWTVERQGNGYSVSNDSKLRGCIMDGGYYITPDRDEAYVSSSSSLFTADVSSTKYTLWNTPTYVAILMAAIATSVIINFIWICLKSRKSISEKIVSSSKTVLSITIHSDFDEDDECVRTDQLHIHYKKKISNVHMEYILKLLLHTGTNIALTFPWALAYHEASKRHQVLTEIGNCLGVKGTVKMEDISLERLWWGQWVLPLAMALLGVLNYGFFRLYVKYGHPWRRLLSSDNDRIVEWRTLKLWEILDSKNDNRGEVLNGDNMNISEAASDVSIYEHTRGVLVGVDPEVNSTNKEEKFKEEEINETNKSCEVLVSEREEVYVEYDAIVLENEFNVTIEDDICIMLVDEKDMDVLLAVEDLQGEQEDDAGKREEVHTPKQKSKNRDVEEQVNMDNLSIDGYTCVELVDNNETEAKDNVCVGNNYSLGQMHEYKDKEEKENMEQKDDYRNKEEDVLKGNKSIEGTICLKLVAVDKTKKKEMYREPMLETDGDEDQKEEIDLGSMSIESENEEMDKENEKQVNNNKDKNKEIIKEHMSIEGKRKNVKCKNK